MPFILLLFSISVGPVDCRTSRLSDQWTVGPVDCRTSGLSSSNGLYGALKFVADECHCMPFILLLFSISVGPMECLTNGVSDQWTYPYTPLSQYANLPIATPSLNTSLDPAAPLRLQGPVLQKLLTEILSSLQEFS